jgi:hypothetical protein
MLAMKAHAPPKVIKAAKAAAAATTTIGLIDDGTVIA